MNNNDVLRRVRYTFDMNDDTVESLFKYAGVNVPRSTFLRYMKREKDKEFKIMPDKMLAAFLNGFIVSRRGKKDGVEFVNEATLTNNIILRKLKIALNIREDDILEFYDLADVRLSRHELSAFFRHPDKPQYRPCQDQFLRNFLQGMQRKYRPTLPPS